MSTDYYNLPTVDPADSFAPSKAINELADAADHVLQHIEQVGADSHYTLPPATKQSLGGVIAGDNVNITSDGTISVDVNPYVLPAASYTKLGGVIVGQGEGLELDPDGTLHIDDSSIGVPAGSVTEEKIQDNAVSVNKIQDGAVTYEKLAPTIQEYITKGEEALEGKATTVTVDYSTASSSIRDIDIAIKKYANFYGINGSCTLVADGSTSEWDLFTYDETKLPASKCYGPGSGNILAVSGDTAYAGRIITPSGSKLGIRFGGNLPAGTYSIDVNVLLIGTN